MSSAEHLIENAIYAMYKGQDPLEVLDYDYNKMMLQDCGMNKYDVYAMAQHVVWGLYDGKYPDFPI